MLTEHQIKFLNKVCPNRWAKENGIINTDGSVNISNMNLTQIPVPFGQVYGHFYCRENKLTTLEGAPSIVNTYFDYDSNQLTTLEGGPKEVGGYYSCTYNQLTNLIGAPEICNSSFYCRYNQLTSLEGCPRLIKRNLFCNNNPHLEYLWGIGQVEGKVAYDNENEINVWIIECARKDIIFPHFTLEENINWIKMTGQYSCLLKAPQEILQHFSSYIKNILLDVC